ncbi:lipase family protein [Vibrio vulnificus]|uniref:lipase family protein n=2 Tax=Vibrio vulnificus TaxID=672 RepID=UPI00092B0AA1|nr:lipase family protein [Vibrio vulnificus]EGR0061982.1 lipase family protein [Vibrio vulnificus]EHU9450431.1 lipase family protein [Vibrio vulnificus]EID4390786.1 lipase family protein [Vibrio vulnificus]EIU7060693.1 lipase family protein [Vibrio vulnificus]EIU7747460.1 lipase family protein [Vibrio vulnificus]
MATLTPKLASQIANIPYEIYLGTNIKLLTGEYKKHFSFSEDSTFNGQTGGLALLDSIPLIRKVIPGAMRTSKAFAVIGIGKGVYQDELVVSIRGTQNANDWVTNANIGYKGSPNGSIAHAGFINSFNSIKNQLKQHLSKNRAPKKIHCVGHSLGGALASLCADWLKSEYACRVNLYTFGAPRVGLEQYAIKSGNRADKIFRCTHGGDPVPMIPLWPFVHAPYQGQEYRLDSSTKLAFSAHSMSTLSNPGYLNTANAEEWGALKTRANQYLHTPVRLKFEHRNQASFSEYWANKISAALITLLKDSLLLATVTAQASISAGLTFYDLLSRHLEKVAKASKVREMQVRGLLGHMLVFAGKPVVAIEDMTASFIRKVFETVIGKLYRVAKQAILAVR